jgi:hypothetical protein
MVLELAVEGARDSFIDAARQAASRRQQGTYR